MSEESNPDRVCLSSPVFETEEEYDCQCSHMECPVCGVSDIRFFGEPKLVNKQLEIEMAGACGHRWTFLLGEQDEMMVAICKIQDWPGAPNPPKPLW